MATNPLKSRMAAPQVRRNLQESVDYGNAHLASIGRTDVHWFAHDGQLCIGFRGRPGA